MYWWRHIMLGEIIKSNQIKSKLCILPNNLIMVDAIRSLLPTSVSRRLNISWIMFKIIMFFYENAWLYVMVCILLTFGKLLLDRIISSGGSILPLFIYLPVPSPESKRSCILCAGVSILPLTTVFVLLNFGTVPSFRHSFYLSLIQYVIVIPSRSD
jgi:hypothetical protein